jgi:hypothetical protein
MWYGVVRYGRWGERKKRGAVLRISECRSCKEPIVWCTTERNKNMPVDAEPTHDGTFVLEDQDSEKPRALYRPDAKGEKYASHFSTCVDADDWRKD